MAHSPDVPQDIEELILLWKRALTGSGLAGLAVADKRVVLADKTPDTRHDAFRCLDAETGKELWCLTYPAPKKMDYDNAPRATPVLHNGFAYLLGAFGDLHCVGLDTGKMIWKRNFTKDFGSKVPNWGFTSSPLVVDDKLIINPGAPEASLAALDLRTAKVIWTTAGEPPAYAGLILGTFGGRRQIVGYDKKTVGGWDPKTGERLWTLTPKEENDYNVPTPVNVEGKLLLASEMNGTRLYGFDSQGRIIAEPLVENEDFSPDMSSPVVVDDLVFGCGWCLMCLDLNDGLKTAWESEDEHYGEYCTFIVGNGRVLTTSIDGWLHLLDVTATEHVCVSRIDMFPGMPQKPRRTWSHPALVGDRYYVRNQAAAYCFRIRSASGSKKSSTTQGTTQ